MVYSHCNCSSAFCVSLTFSDSPVVIYWERAVFLAFRLCYFIPDIVLGVVFLSRWCLGQDMELDCIGS